jgi:hypothetical protein
MNKTTLLSSILALFIVTGCETTVEKADANPTPHDMKKGEGLFSGKSGNLLDAFRGEKEASGVTGGASMTINPYLWRAALESISFMPLQQSDSTGGLLITDWYSNPDDASERMKVNVYILGLKLSPQSLKVAVFKQEFQNNQWVDIEVSPKTARQLEDIILTNARILKVKSQ